jgi:hypothetical protein
VLSDGPCPRCIHWEKRCQFGFPEGGKNEAYGCVTYIAAKGHEGTTSMTGAVAEVEPKLMTEYQRAQRERTERLRPIIVPLLKEGKGRKTISRVLAEQGILSRMGTPLSQSQVKRMVDRISDLEEEESCQQQ